MPSAIAFGVQPGRIKKKRRRSLREENRRSSRSRSGEPSKRRR
jgi:hypothetical protein